MTRRRLAVALTAVTVVVGTLSAADAEPQLAVLAGLVLVAVLGLFAAFDVLRDADPVAWARAPRPPMPLVADEAVEGIADQLQHLPRSSSAVRETLLALADERVRDRHGIDRQSDPEAAKTVFGPGLLDLAHQRRHRCSGVAEVQQLLDEIEAI